MMNKPTKKDKGPAPSPETKPAVTPPPAPQKGTMKQAPPGKPERK